LFFQLKRESSVTHYRSKQDIENVFHRNFAFIPFSGREPCIWGM
jgi:hypothetical protein